MRCECRRVRVVERAPDLVLVGLYPEFIGCGVAATPDPVVNLS